MRRGLRARELVFWIGLTIAPGCLAENLCLLLVEREGLAPRAAPEEFAFLASVDKLVGTPTNIHLFPTSDSRVRKRAAAQMCGFADGERWVFYDESYLNSLLPNGRKFLLAHEAAHHLSNDTVIVSSDPLPDSRRNEMELKADRSAARWLTRLGVTRGQLLQAFEALGFDPESKDGYPTRAERRAIVIAGIADETPKPPPPKRQVNPKDELTYVWIPPGTFMMGCSSGDNDCYPNESPAHDVTFKSGFWMGQTPVTQEAYKRVIGNDISHFKEANLPVNNLTWEKAKQYCEAVGMRLPTEAQWEYAARAETLGARYGDIKDVAWYDDGVNRSQTHPVGLKDPNAWKLYDMLGNVWQWTADWYAEKYYDQREEEDPQGPPAGPSRTFRGGSWGSLPRSVRASYRGRGEPGYDESSFGVRCVGKTLP